MSGGYLRRGRVLYLRNNCVHGEGRLLDPDGSTRREIATKPNEINTDQNTFLSDMEQSFRNEFGDSTPPQLLVYTHYLPCTLDSHHCAELLRDYVTKTSRNVTVGYTEVFVKSDQERALQTLKDSGIEVWLIPWQQEADLRQLSMYFSHFNFCQREDAPIDAWARYQLHNRQQNIRYDPLVNWEMDPWRQPF
ncbi:hypothetical protein DPMN_044287 [Dreissena polymorpha]|uniref:Uncharacterized protein n=1 Tax=Dreissena polymorpha TaxID=45954 RepID=A0A9D4HYL0_DREPO|nr:hypothetical protein DPMN_044287 [Dreissena polymorpha]